LHCGVNQNFLFAGMMGSGKTTVGNILAEVLGYYFFDRFVSRGILGVDYHFTFMIIIVSLSFAPISCILEKLCYKQ